MTDARPFPCLDGHRYSGCVGLDCCSAERCWNGRRLRACSGPLRVDSFDRPLRVLRYTAGDCPNCLHAVDLRVDNDLRSTGGRQVEHWTMCELGLWAGPASLYNLLYHRAPVKHVGHCPSFEDTPIEQMRPELVQMREADRQRARLRRARLREAKVAQLAEAS